LDANAGSRFETGEKRAHLPLSDAEHHGLLLA
jgi:hypothetical protein